MCDEEKKMGAVRVFMRMNLKEEKEDQ